MAPDCVQERPWGSINWILNNWQSIVPTATWQDIQVTIWTLVHGGDHPCGCIINPGNSLAYNETNVHALVASGEAHTDYIPGSGDQVALILLVGNLCPVPPESGPDKQMTIVRVPWNMLYCNWENVFGNSICADLE